MNKQKTRINKLEKKKQKREDKKKDSVESSISIQARKAISEIETHMSPTSTDDPKTTELRAELDKLKSMVSKFNRR